MHPQPFSLDIGSAVPEKIPNNGILVVIHFPIKESGLNLNYSFYSTASLMLYVLSAATATCGGHKIEGVATTVYPNQKIAKSQFVLHVDGSSYRLSLGEPSGTLLSPGQIYHFVDPAGEQIPYCEIGSDGIDTYVLRASDSFIASKDGAPARDSTGRYISKATASVWPGCRPPEDSLNQAPQIIWLAYARSFTSAENPEVQQIFPTSSAAGLRKSGHRIPLDSVELEITAPTRLAGLAETIVFRAPGFEFTRSLPVTGSAPARKETATGEYRVLLNAPFDKGYIVGRYSTEVSDLGAQAFPTKSKFDFFRPVGQGEPKSWISVLLEVDKVESWSAPSGFSFLPRLPENSYVHDYRILLPNGKPEKAISRKGKWRTRSSKTFQTAYNQYAELSKKIERKSTGGRYVSIAGVFFAIGVFGLFSYKNRKMYN